MGVLAVIETFVGERTSTKDKLQLAVTDQLSQLLLGPGHSPLDESRFARLETHLYDFDVYGAAPLSVTSRRVAKMAIDGVLNGFSWQDDAVNARLIAELHEVFGIDIAHTDQLHSVISVSGDEGCPVVFGA